MIAGRGLRDGWRSLSPAVAGFAWVMPLIGAALAARFAWLIGLSAGSTATLMTLGHPPRLTEEFERTGEADPGDGKRTTRSANRRDVRPVVHRRPADGSRLRQ
ncbi:MULTISPECIES: hypothetical protein [unclassified Bradyrhizobium]|uniref:hypothetical protein n=1 Tax=unclassified Bradyrhizobium TaxID=2631580 RepID=UPI00070BBE5A|nr:MULTISPECIES: hypothetical protein [unclassified Bradyrhizobium]KQT26781.1 hypothetical protein ASG57_19485 [Bradyrhizobium sp. Leaf396]